MQEEDVEDSPNGSNGDDDFEMQDDFGESSKPSLGDRVVVKDEDEEPQLPLPVRPLDVDEEEPKPKPALQLRYNGFNIFGRCLCIVVEPWPPVRATPAPPSFPQSAFRAASLTPSVVPNAGIREQTPLFLPENDERGRSETPAPTLQNWRPPVPRFSDPPPEDDEDEGELLLFSQVLNATGESRMEADEEDDFAGADALFGDADETRELN